MWLKSKLLYLMFDARVPLMMYPFTSVLEIIWPDELEVYLISGQVQD